MFYAHCHYQRSMEPENSSAVVKPVLVSKFRHSSWDNKEHCTVE